MKPQALVATRKGLFPLYDEGGAWRLGAAAFLGDPVTMALSDARDGALYAALNLGHFGVKLRRSRDGGASWQEVAAPAYPPQVRRVELRHQRSLGAVQPPKLLRVVFIQHGVLHRLHQVDHVRRLPAGQ